MHIGNWLPFVFVALVIGWFIYRIAKFGGFKASLFGAPIVRTIGEVRLEQSTVSTTLRVHVLDRGPAQANVGLEISQSSPGSIQVRICSLAGPDVNEFVRLLNEAAREAK